VARRRPPEIPGLIARAEPLPAHAAHVDPADPRGLRRRGGPGAGSGLVTAQARMHPGVAGVLAAVLVWVAVERGSWGTFAWSGLTALSGYVAHLALARFDRSAQDRRDALRVAGAVATGLVLLLGGIPLLAF
jgi:hypothetical protein